MIPEAKAGLMTVFSILLWALALVAMGFGQPWSACFLFVGSGLLLVWPVLFALKHPSGAE